MTEKLLTGTLIHKIKVVMKAFYQTKCHFNQIIHDTTEMKIKFYGEIKLEFNQAVIEIQIDSETTDIPLYLMFLSVMSPEEYHLEQESYLTHI